MPSWLKARACTRSPCAPFESAADLAAVRRVQKEHLAVPAAASQLGRVGAESDDLDLARAILSTTRLAACSSASQITTPPVSSRLAIDLPSGAMHRALQRLAVLERFAARQAGRGVPEPHRAVAACRSRACCHPG